jgi:tetratricopeptide (TPR) repeat protein
MGHAWLGSLRVRGSGGPAEWNFDAGRFGEYDRARGQVRDPQTGLAVSDGRVAMTGALTGLRPQLPLAADALCLLARTREGGTGPTIQGLTPPSTTKPRPTGLAGRLALIDEALRLAPQSIPAWLALAEISAELTPDQRRQWGTRVVRAVPDKSADFAFDVVGAMIDRLPTPRENADTWAVFGPSFASKRKDLAAEAMIRQADALAAEKQPDAAYDLYQQVVSRSLNEGTAAVTALLRIEAIIAPRGDAGLVADAWGDALKRARKPSGGAPEFLYGSTWARIAVSYYRALVKAGRTEEAAKLQDRIDATLGLRRLDSDR